MSYPTHRIIDEVISSVAFNKQKALPLSSSTHIAMTVPSKGVHCMLIVFIDST